MSTVIIGLALAVIVAGIIVKMVKNKKAGKSRHMWKLNNIL